MAADDTILVTFFLSSKCYIFGDVNGLGNCYKELALSQKSLTSCLRKQKCAIGEEEERRKKLVVVEDALKVRRLLQWRKTGEKPSELKVLHFCEPQGNDARGAHVFWSTLTDPEKLKSNNRGRRNQTLSLSFVKPTADPLSLSPEFHANNHKHPKRIQTRVSKFHDGGECAGDPDGVQPISFVPLIILISSSSILLLLLLQFPVKEKPSAAFCHHLLP
ncbi:hypothetical protein H6P81_007337 [Aristolochia fimbriata]|uniref:Uncharacterized protein n=1 Tax=Aristolochia fimbriata TaxID=158543 RepID=A0AAV7F042_ARIFI|nr:hypothetical protein H6P81_007337 [Aristolochia fimbriata]